MFWIPEFLTRERGLNLAGIAWWHGFRSWSPTWQFRRRLLVAALFQRGWSVNRVRKTMMVLATCFSPLAIVAVFSNSMFWTMTMISISIFFWILWSITVHSLPGDYFPARAVGSVYGFAGTGSTIGSMISTFAVGAVLDVTNSYVPVFIGLSLLMPIGLALGLFLMGRVEPIRDFDTTSARV